MLYQLTAPKVRHPEPNAADFDSADPKYRAYLHSLAGKGFFGDEVQGSGKWKEMEGIAREGWLRTKADRYVLARATGMANEARTISDYPVPVARPCPLLNASTTPSPAPDPDPLPSLTASSIRPAFLPPRPPRSKTRKTGSRSTSQGWRTS